MTIHTTPKLTLRQQVTLGEAAKATKKAAKRGVMPFYRARNPEDLAILESRGWRVHTHTQPSYVSGESWLMTLD